MNIQRVFGAAAVACLWLFSSLHAPSAARSAEATPQKQSLAIPVAVASPRSVECVVPFGPPTSISAVAFSPDAKKLAVAGYREVLVWDLEKAALSKRLGSGQSGTQIGALAFLQDAKLLAVGEGTPHSSGAVRIFDVDSGQQTHAFEEPGDVVYCLALSPDGKLLAGGGADALAHVWSVDEKKLVATLKDHGGYVLGAGFSADGKFLATASADRTARVWDVGTWKSVVTISESQPLDGAAFSADGTLVALAVGGPDDRAVRLVRRDNGRPARTISTKPTMPLGVVWIAQGNLIFAPCSDNTVKAYNGGNGALQRTFSGHTDWVDSVALSPDGAKLASGSADGTVKLWNAADGTLLATLVQLSPRTDEWLVLTGQGYLATSTSDVLQWKTANVKTPLEQLTGLLQKPESVQQVIAGGKVEPPPLE
jgi:WD40 repeat protein